MRLAAIFYILLFAQLCTAQECVVGARNPQLGVHALVNSCDDIGTYSIGAYYDGSWEKLTFHYPQPWKGTFASFNVDGNLHCTSKQPRNCSLADPYVVQAPTAADNTLATSWMLPSDVKVTQELVLESNATWLRYLVENKDIVNHSVSLRIHLDAMIGENDGAPIYVPGKGLITSEQEYVSPSFEYFKAYNHPSEPTIVATADFANLKGFTAPSKVVLADWKKSKDTSWDYVPEGAEITGDSAALIYYDLGVIEPGQSSEAVLSVASAQPVLTKEQGEIGVTEITFARVGGRYCPGDEATFHVDVLNTGQARRARAGFSVTRAGITYYNDTVDEIFGKDVVSTLTWVWPIPELNESGAFTVSATLYNESGAFDDKVREGAVSVELDRCGISPVIDAGVGLLGSLVVAAAATAFALFLTFLAYLWMNRGDVTLTKSLDAEKVNVTLKNETRKTLKDVTIQDSIPQQAEVKVKTMGVLRKRDQLSWNVGRLSPGASVTLEYSVQSGLISGYAKATWDGGSRTAR